MTGRTCWPRPPPSTRAATVSCWRPPSTPCWPRPARGRLDITAVAAGTGPGPYTGLRAGLVTARVLGSALGVPVYGVCTLDVVAAGVASTGTAAGQGFIVATDARRREVYWARYDADGRRLDGPAVGFPADVAGTAGRDGGR